MIKDSWKFTRRQYAAYLNTPASVDVNDTGGRDNYELALGDVVGNVDAELVGLIRAVENSEHNPDQAWALRMMQRFPWISGVALVGGDGAVNARYPEYFAKEFDAGPLLEADPKQRPGMLRAYVQMNKDSPEIYLGNPVYIGEEMRGIITAHFDPAALASMSPDPDAFSMITPAGVVWPGRFGAGAAAGENWEEVLKERTSGLTSGDKSVFFWITRYIGNLPLVYAMPVSIADEEIVRASPENPVPSPPETKADGGAAAHAGETPAADRKENTGETGAVVRSVAPAPSETPEENPALVDTPGARF
jgi:hypothetical protein